MRTRFPPAEHVRRHNHALLHQSLHRFDFFFGYRNADSADSHKSHYTRSLSTGIRASSAASSLTNT